MENSDATISENFLENLWPLILENNDCEIETTNACEYFMPEKNFDHLWAHELLAKKCFEDYSPVIEFPCKPADKLPTEIKEEAELEQPPYRGPEADILPLDQQLDLVQQDVDVRKQLADDFANRRFPWYIQRSLYQNQFEITADMQTLFKDKFQFEILRSLQRFECQLMIIDVAPAVPLKYMERWLKFSPYAATVAVIHDEDLYEEIKKCYNLFQAVLIQENLESTWHEQLEQSLDVGIKKAKELFLYEDESRAIVFVFSQNRGVCVCDKFKVLRKS